MIIAIYRISIVMLLSSLLAYILIVLKEKYFLKRNMIVLDNRYLDQKDINETDITEFIFQGLEIRSGDEVRVVTDLKEYEGIIIGLKYEDESVHMITYEKEIKKIEVIKIKDFVMLTKYGSFF